jgi:hypothetical protein
LPTALLLQERNALQDARLELLAEVRQMANATGAGGGFEVSTVRIPSSSCNTFTILGPMPSIAVSEMTSTGATRRNPSRSRHEPLVSISAIRSAIP